MGSLEAMHLTVLSTIILGPVWFVDCYCCQLRLLPGQLQLATRNRPLQGTYTVKPPIIKGHFDLPTKNKPKVLVYTHYIKSALKEDNLSTKDKMAGPEGVLIKRFHCISHIIQHDSSFMSSSCPGDLCVLILHLHDTPLSHGEGAADVI